MKASQFSDAQKAFILKQGNDAFRLPRSAGRREAMLQHRRPTGCA